MISTAIVNTMSTQNYNRMRWLRRADDEGRDVWSRGTSVLLLLLCCSRISMCSLSRRSALLSNYQVLLGRILRFRLEGLAYPICSLYILINDCYIILYINIISQANIVQTPNRTMPPIINHAHNTIIFINNHDAIAIFDNTLTPIATIFIFGLFATHFSIPVSLSI